MCVGQRGGGHGRIIEFAGHIITAHGAHSIQRRTLKNMTEMTILVFTATVQAAVQLRVTNASHMKAQWTRTAPALHTHRFCTAHACSVKPALGYIYTSAFLF